MCQPTDRPFHVHQQNHHRHGRPTALIAFVCFGLLMVGVMQGCIATATVATIIALSGAGGHEATVELDVEPDEVYAAMIRILQRRPDITVQKEDEKKRLVEASKDKNKMTARVRIASNAMSELTVTAKAGEKTRTDEELALVVVETICDELGVKWKVVKGKLGEKKK
jgi:hypothetical protein